MRVIGERIERRLAEAKADIEGRLAETKADIERRVADMEARLTWHLFGFWAGQITVTAALLGLFYSMLR